MREAKVRQAIDEAVRTVDLDVDALRAELARGYETKSDAQARESLLSQRLAALEKHERQTAAAASNDRQGVMLGKFVAELSAQLKAGAAGLLADSEIHEIFKMVMADGGEFRHASKVVADWIATRARLEAAEACIVSVMGDSPAPRDAWRIGKHPVGAILLRAWCLSRDKFAVGWRHLGLPVPTWLRYLDEEHATEIIRRLRTELESTTHALTVAENELDNAEHDKEELRRQLDNAHLELTKLRAQARATEDPCASHD